VLINFGGFKVGGVKDNVFRTAYLNTWGRVCLVASGLGVTFVIDRLQFLVGAHVICRPLADCPIALHLAAAWRKNNADPPLETFLAILQSSSRG
jgi:DNA-binding transcriptional LysR family regulator